MKKKYVSSVVVFFVMISFSNAQSIGVVDKNGTVSKIENTLKVVTVTANYSLDTKDYTVLCNASSGNITLTLPPANTTYKGKIFIIKKIDSSTNSILFDPSYPLYDYDGEGILECNLPYAFRVQCDGVTWFKL